jgi:hypothetical protein
MKCHHHEVCDTSSVEMMLQELECQLGQNHATHGKTYDDSRARSNLRTDHMQANKNADTDHIDYKIPQHDPENYGNSPNSLPENEF